MTSPETEDVNLKNAVEGEAPAEGSRIETAESAPEQAEAAVATQVEAVAEAIETDPATKEAAQADVVAALREKIEKGDIDVAIAGVESAMAIVQEGGEVGVKEIINQLMEERYRMTLDQFLNAFKPTKLEYLNPTLAIAQESAVWVAMKAFEIEPSDMGLMKRAEFRWKVGADALKVFSLLAKFVPEVSFLAAPTEVASETLGRMGNAMEKINGNPDATIYDNSKDLTVAMLPRDAEGNIDRERVLGIISVAGGMVEHQAGDSEYVRAAGELLRTNPARFAEALEKIDGAVSKK